MKKIIIITSFLICYSNLVYAFFGLKDCEYKLEIKPETFFIISVKQKFCSGIHHVGVIKGNRIIIINDKLEVVSDSIIENDLPDQKKKRFPNLQKKPVEFKAFR